MASQQHPITTCQFMWKFYIFIYIINAKVKMFQAMLACYPFLIKTLFSFEYNFEIIILIDYK